MIRIQDLRKSYKTVEVLNVPELLIGRGESFGLVGNNGAGKTTLFRLILDLIRPSEGMVLSKEEPVKGNEGWKSYTGSYLDEGFLIGFLTPEEYFQFVAKLNKVGKGDMELFENRFAEFFNGEILSKKKYIKDLSKGNQKKVGIAAALMAKPEVVLLDEPFANLDPTSQFRLKELLKSEKNDSETTLLISSHDLNHVTEVCERIVVLNKGSIVQDIATSSDTLKDLEVYFSA
jgi:ABC-2 type transport system ATP-binding protein